MKIKLILAAAVLVLAGLDVHSIIVINRAPHAGPLSHCFVPGESHADGVRPCVVVE